MTKKIKISEIPEFDAAEYLTSDEDVAAYLTTILEDNDAALLAAALGIRLRGDAEVAVDEGAADLVHQRDEARGAKDWARADELRAELEAAGWLVEDSAEGTRIRRL